MCFDKENISYIPLISIISSLMAGVGIAALFYGGFLTFIRPFLYVTLVLGILGIIVFFITLFCFSKKANNISNFSLVPISVGGIITSALALNVILVPAAISVLILLSATFFFMFMLITKLLFNFSYNL